MNPKIIGKIASLCAAVSLAAVFGIVLATFGWKGVIFAVGYTAIVTLFCAGAKT